MVFDELIGNSTALLPVYERNQPPDASPEVLPNQPHASPQRSGPLIAHRDLNALIDDRLERRRE